MLLKGKGYYTLGIYPMLIAAGGVAFDTWLRNRIARVILPLLMVLMTIPVVPIGLPVYDKEGLKIYFKVLDEKYGIDLGRRFEDGSIHSLPQDYADMIGWGELAALADSAYNMIENKEASLIYAENYGQAGAVTIIGRKYGLPEAVSFHESFGTGSRVTSRLRLNHWSISTMNLGKTLQHSFPISGSLEKSPIPMLVSSGQRYTCARSLLQASTPSGKSEQAISGDLIFPWPWP